MKITNLKFGLFSLLTVFTVSCLLISCQKDGVSVNDGEFTKDEVGEEVFLEDESKTYFIYAPEGMVEDVAIEWAADQSHVNYSELGDETILESRWCYTQTASGFNSGVCICQSNGRPECMNYCHTIRTTWCGGWSGGRYVVTKTVSYSGCSC